MRFVKYFKVLMLFVLSFSLAPDLKKVNNVEKTMHKYNQKIKIIELKRLSHYSLSTDETDSNPLEFSCGNIKNIKHKDLKIIAVSRDIFFKDNKKHLCNKIAYLMYDGKIEKVIIYDTMNKRYEKSADLLVSSKKEAYELGVIENAKLIFVY